MKRRKNYATQIKVILLILIVGIFIMGLIGNLKNNRKIRYESVYRNIEDYKFPKEPKDKNIAWDSQVPKFITEDIEYLKKNSEVSKIKYEFGEQIIEIEIIDDMSKLKIQSLETTKYEGLSNFSIYKNGSYITIYGYRYSAFYKVRLGLKKGDCKDNYMTASKDIPFDADVYILNTIGGYQLCTNNKDRDSSSDNCLYLYKDGELIEKKEINNVIDIYSCGIFICENYDIYMSWVIIENEEPTITIKYVGNVDSIYSNGDEYWRDGVVIEDDNSVLPIFKSGDELVIPVPTDWKVYEKYVLHQDVKCNATDLEMKLIKMSDCFDHADIEWYYDGWKANIALNLNGKKGIFTYRINGYDTSVSLTSEEKNMTTTVRDGDSFWKEVDRIREMYKKYYDYPDYE